MKASKRNLVATENLDLSDLKCHALEQLQACKFVTLKQPFQIVPITKEEEANLKIYYDYYETPFGLVLLASTNLGICYLAFESEEKPALPFLQKIYPKATFELSQTTLHRNLLSYFDENYQNEITFHIKGTPFQFAVWKALLEIPKGSLTSYGEIAKHINKPKAFRAVGTAIGKNPISLFIPCHRVIQTNGKLGNYMWGLKIKRLLIYSEM